MSGYILDWGFVRENADRFLAGFGMTLQLLAAAGILAVALGTLAACARLSNRRSARLGAVLYLETMRNSPILVKMYFIYFGMPGFGIFPSPFVSAVMALGLHNGSYLMEIFRASLVGVPAGQREAAYSLGLSRAATFRKVVLPQALRTALPSTGNVLPEIAKDTSLASALSVAELYFVFVAVVSLHLRAYEALAVVALAYLALTWAIDLLVRALQARLDLPYGRHAGGAGR